MANVRKLMRMAREYEADEGRDLRGFIDALAERDAIQTREGEAPLEAEALDAVRMMTVHRAKGLEFPVVCLADLGKDGREDDGSLRISEDGSVGPEARRARRRGGGQRRLERIKAEGKVAAEEEERRIFYVAVTRAQEHLVLSGATDLAKRPDAGGARRADALDLARVLRGPAHRRGAGHPRGPPRGPRRGGSLDALHAGDGRRGAAGRRTARHAHPSARSAPGYEQPLLELGMLPAPRALPVSRLSYSGLEDYRRCGYRFYLQRALRLAPVERAAGGAASRRPSPASAPCCAARSCTGCSSGSTSRGRCVPGDADVAAAIEMHGVEALPARCRGRARHGRAASRAPSCASASRLRGACAPSCRSPSRST